MKLIESKDYNQTIKTCVATDAENIVKNHKNFNMSIDQLIEFLTKDIERLKDYKLLEVYTNENDLIGAFGIESKINVHPFFVKPQYRKKDYMSSLMKLMLENLDDKFLMCCYESNIPVKEFYEKNHGIFLGKVNLNNQISLVYSFEKEKF